MLKFATINLLRTERFNLNFNRKMKSLLDFSREGKLESLANLITHIHCRSCTCQRCLVFLPGCTQAIDESMKMFEASDRPARNPINFTTVYG